MRQLTTKGIVERLAQELDSNGGRISSQFLLNEVERDDTKITFEHLTDNMRVCIIRLESGHEVIGKAQVLNKDNDNPAVGNEVAYTNAVNELWTVFGNVALVIEMD